MLTERLSDGAQQEAPVKPGMLTIYETTSEGKETKIEAEAPQVGFPVNSK
ncbi:hypothetical protein SpiGrapes_0611 [Sphaerochaeta pleomorpha str. Grapes]|uniref:Uncharacterized protein n=1 Tax=Sphaerochaeta pleomorpha (strain ATCC BAA-1885 / DSM 22778 / Grapes) TaxID=158190 RepID=G8QXF4_SPHPG|nr:hypothetical protein SpiGrapes_0611 [Sphaerochaeta pleomorpha str. Grapes]